MPTAIQRLIIRLVNTTMANFLLRVDMNVNNISISTVSALRV